MQEAVPEGKGAMAAILGLDDDAVRAACAEAGGEVQAVNFNAPGQVVIAGQKAAVERAIEKLQGEGREARGAAAGERAVPFLADEARRRQAARAICRKSKLATPAIPVVNNVDVSDRERPGAHQGRAGAPGGLAGALGRDDPADGRARA